MNINESLHETFTHCLLRVSAANSANRNLRSNDVNVLVEHAEALCQLFLALAGLVLL